MDSWSELEVELIVANYFEMLSKEISGISYSKTAFRNDILPLLKNRSSGSVEFKHQNISAVLINLGQPYIKGYLPRFNYQKILEEKVIEFLIQNKKIENVFKLFADKEIISPTIPLEFDRILVDAPASNIASEPIPLYGKNPIKTNYLEREQRNNRLGLLGEQFVLEYEKWTLIQIGKEKLADEIRWISQEEGDGAGFDILSKNRNGSDKYVEVKTTKLGKETPFYFSQNELQFSKKHSANFHLYRLFDFESEARLFTKNGALDSICHSIPLTFKGYF